MNDDKCVLRFQLTPEAQREITEFSDSLALLPKEIAESLSNDFLGLLQSASLEVSVADGPAASGAGNYVIGLRLAGYRELLAAAAGAGKFKL